MDAPQCPVTGCRGGPDTSLEGAPVGGGLVPSGLFAPLARIFDDGLGLANQMLAAQARDAFLVVAGRCLRLEKLTF